MKSRFFAHARLKGKTVAVLFVCCFFLFFFRSVIFEGRQFSFRDGANFYYPLLEYVHSYWKSGEFPLWDPCENAGQPLAASASAAVFYPGQLIFFLSDILPVSYGVCFALYHLIHIAMAIVTMFFLCRHWKISFTGSLVAAVCYTFCGSIFGQYCNTIFLVGAAWLPLGVLFGDRLLLKRDLRSFVLLAVVLAMTVLGGEPQSAYFIGLLLGGLWLVYWRGGVFRKVESGRVERSNRAAVKSSRGHYIPSLLTGRLTLLVYAALCAGILSLVQVVPTMEMTAHSDRVANDMPFSIWDVPGFVVRNAMKAEQTQPLRKSPYIFYDEPDMSGKSVWGNVYDGLFCGRLEYGGHCRDIYHFSLGPWQLGELFWPSIAGKCPPDGSRWVSYLPNDVEWVYSLYIGIAPMLLGVAAMTWRVRRRRPAKSGKDSRKRRIREPVPLRATPNRMIRVWCSWTIVLAFLGSLGAYGPIWFARALFGSETESSALAFDNFDPVGGIYWLLCVLFPKFSTFRFPAKLVTPAILALAVLAGIGWDCGRKNRRFAPIVAVYCGISFIMLAIIFMMGSAAFDMSRLREYSTGAIFDSYDATRAWNVVLAGIAQGMIIIFCFSMFWLCGNQRRRLCRLLTLQFRSDSDDRPIKNHGVRMNRKMSGCACFILVCVDLYLGNASVLVTSPQHVFDTTPRFVQTIQDCEIANRDQTAANPRYFRFNWYPYVFVNPKTTATITDRIEWERATVHPKYNEPLGFSSLQGSVTMRVNDFCVVYEWLEWSSGRRDMTPFLAFLGCRYLVFPITVSGQGMKEVEVRFKNEWTRLLHTSKNLNDDQLRANDLPVSATLWEVTLPTSRVKILRNPELDRPDWTIIDQLNSGHVDHAEPGEYARIVKYEGNRLEMDVKLTRPAAIVLPEQYFPGWYASFAPLGKTDESYPLEITKTLDFMRRVDLPAGEFRVKMEYCPPRFFFALVVTLIAWFAAVVAILFGKNRKICPCG